MAERDGGVYVVGAGLAGPAAPAASTRRARPPPCWRPPTGSAAVRTDRVDDSLLDRGFQVLLTAYPEARDALDYRELELYPFYRGR